MCRHSAGTHIQLALSLDEIWVFACEQVLLSKQNCCMLFSRSRVGKGNRNNWLTNHQRAAKVRRVRIGEIGEVRIENEVYALFEALRYNPFCKEVSRI
jgi:hypothetical protein